MSIIDDVKEDFDNPPMWNHNNTFKENILTQIIWMAICLAGFFLVGCVAYGFVRLLEITL